ncbi:hypothetical protein ACP70R_041929 [Stipagrostis hirtigluma subsp. patula]
MTHPMLSISAARCSVPLRLRPHVAVAWPYRRTPAHTTAVSARPRRGGSRGPRRDRSWNDGVSDSDADDRLDDDFFGQELEDDDEPEQDELPPRRAPLEPQLRGSDVLRALQRAVAAKEAKKKKDKKPAVRRQGKEKLKGGGEAEVAGEVRPVVVRPEWAGRIRELELRVQQLADKYHHYQ